MNLARRFLEFHGITPPELAEFMPAARSETLSARRQRAWRYVRGETGWTLETIEAVLACCAEKLGRRVTFEEVFQGEGLPESLRRAS
ncbi:MAG TPA: hypothetical protein PLN64_01710 [Candidatus Bipolaricaulis anaerobius]|nr:hypothetical protein [Candidatus Bipolaricaulis anaerobius]